MSSPGQLHKLSAHEIDSKYKKYKDFNEEFERWLVEKAKSKGWQGRNEGVDRFSEQGELLRDKSIKLPPGIQTSLEECIKLRQQLIQHYEALSPREIKDSKSAQSWKRHVEKNEGHDKFNHVLQYILSILGVNTSDSDKVRRRRIAIEMRKTLREMQKLTVDVIRAWEQYRVNRLSLSQVTLVTHAAVEESQSIEKKFYDQWPPNSEDYQFVQDFYTDYDPKLVDLGDNSLKTSAKTTLDDDLTGLLNQDRYYPQSQEFETSMDILHWPTIYVLSNFQGMMEQWKTYPVPGHPLCLEHVFYEGKKHRSKGPGKYETYTDTEAVPDVRGLKDNNERKIKRKKHENLKAQYKDQIKSTVEHLNEILYLHTFPVDTDTQTATFGVYRECQEEKEGESDPEEKKEVFLPKDIFSKALSDVVQDRGKISMSTSFTIQLLVKIHHLFEKVPSEATESKALSFREEVHNEATKSSDDDPERTKIRLENESLLSSIYASCQNGHALWMKKQDVPGLTNNFQFQMDDNSKSVVEIGINGDEVSKTTVPASPRIHVVNPYMIDDWRHDVTCHAKTAEYYSNKQPLYAGTLDLVRRLAEYRADIASANSTLSIFALTHLKEVPEAPPEAHYHISPVCEAVMRQHHSWFPQEFQARSASDIIDLIKDKVQKTGKASAPLTNQFVNLMGVPPGVTVNYDMYDTKEDAMMKPTKPLEALWEIFALDHPETRISTFLKELRKPPRRSTRIKNKGKQRAYSTPVKTVWKSSETSVIQEEVIQEEEPTQEEEPIQEQENNNGEGSFVQADADEISRDMGTKYEDAEAAKDARRREINKQRKKKNKVNRKRRAAEAEAEAEAEAKSNTESLARSDKRRKL
ncbi:hypothetical protein BC567DRAFT_205153 [Phyllosticta citribraziliensis]